MFKFVQVLLKTRVFWYAISNVNKHINYAID
jgi:hypothetical protein